MRKKTQEKCQLNINGITPETRDKFKALAALDSHTAPTLFTELVEHAFGERAAKAEELLAVAR